MNKKQKSEIAVDLESIGFKPPKKKKVVHDDFEDDDDYDEHVASMRSYMRQL